MRRAAKVDANHAAVREAFRRHGCTVLDTFTLGNGAPDMVVARNRRTWMVEVKDGAKCPSARNLSNAQMAFWGEWRGHLFIVDDVSQVTGIVETMMGPAGGA